MQAKEVITRTVECISPETQVRDAAQKMKSLDVGFLPVCENDRLVGVLTDRDIVLRVIADGKEVKDCIARDVMTNDIFWCYEDETTDQVAGYMAEKEVRRLMIINRDKRLVGEQKAGEAMKDIAQAPPAQAA